MILAFISLAAGEGGGGSLISLETIAKIVNLLLFIGLMVYILRRPLGESFRARREGIRRDLMRAQEERNAALAKLEDVEARLTKLDAEVAAINMQAQKEASEERARIERATEDDMRKLREQARREIESAAKAARMELREYAAEQSVRLAEEMVRRGLRPEDDERLIKDYVEDLGGLRR